MYSMNKSSPINTVHWNMLFNSGPALKDFDFAGLCERIDMMMESRNIERCVCIMELIYKVNN